MESYDVIAAMLFVVLAILAFALAPMLFIVVAIIFLAYFLFRYFYKS